MNTSATSDEKMMAALVHGSALLAFLGPIVPVVVWASQRRKSKYVSFHALQAMGYQTLMFWLWMLVGVFIMALAILMIPLGIFIMRDSQNGVFAPLIFQIFIFASMFGFLALFFLTGIVGAVSCLLGRDFRYPILGKQLEKYLSYDPDPESQMDETQEDNWVAGICHATAILQLWGVATPLIVWFSQKERSARLRFQSMQTFVYQLTAFVVYMLGMAVYMLFFFGMFFTLMVGGTMGAHRNLQGPPAIIMLVFLGVMTVFWLLIMVLMPVYFLLAGYGGVRVIRGHKFRYPILGKILEKRMEKSQTLEPIP